MTGWVEATRAIKEGEARTQKQKEMEGGRQRPAGRCETQKWRWAGEMGRDERLRGPRWREAEETEIRER